MFGLVGGGRRRPPQQKRRALNVMSTTLELVRQLVAVGDARVSEHGYDELSDDDIPVRDLLSEIDNATVVEDYPAFPNPARWNNNFTERRK